MYYKIEESQGENSEIEGRKTQHTTLYNKTL